MKKRRNFTAQEKAEIVLEVLREESTLAEISRKYEIAQPLLSRWKADFIEHMPSVFDKKGEEIGRIQREHEQEKEDLMKKIGELSMDVDYLKKARTGFSNAEKKTLIERKGSSLSVRRQCELLGLPREKLEGKFKKA